MAFPGATPHEHASYSVTGFRVRPYKVNYAESNAINVTRDISKIYKGISKLNILRFVDLELDHMMMPTLNLGLHL